MNPFPILLLLFLAVPLVEIYVLITVGSAIGAIPTVFFVVFTAVLGALLLRQQGFSTLQRVQTSMARGQLPALEMLEGVLLLIGGALLLTPGFVTDAFGFSLLIPPLRQALVRRFVRIQGGRQPWQEGPLGGQSSDEGPRRPKTIEGEYRREDD